MQAENLIPVNEFCINHNVEISFISSLQQTGLIEISTINESSFIDTFQLRQLERIVHFYFELDINLQGIETITHLLDKIQSLQYEIVRLKNKLGLYEDEF
jgi:chaperone modulatory protein CbpM